MTDVDPNDRTTATGLWMFAETYLQAANHLAETGGDVLRFNAPIYFLYSHAMELTLKAFLRSKGATLEKLRRMGHALPALLERARAQGLTPGAKAEYDAELVALLDVYNSEHQFRYIVTGALRLPEIKALHEVAARLLSATRSACLPH